MKLKFRILKWDINDKYGNVIMSGADGTGWTKVKWYTWVLYKLRAFKKWVVNIFTLNKESA